MVLTALAGGRGGRAAAVAVALPNPPPLLLPPLLPPLLPLQSLRLNVQTVFTHTVLTPFSGGVQTF